MRRLRIVVTGLIGSIPLPGLTYHYLQYALGLRKLGHEVHYLEDTGTWNYSPTSDMMVEDPRPGVEHLARVMNDAGLCRAWTFKNHDGKLFGTSGTALKAVLDRADLLLNVTGATLIREGYRRIPIRVYLDTDPGFVQMRAAQGSEPDVEHLNSHNRFASFGCNIGQADCLIPTLGVKWFPTAQPIVQELWDDIEERPSRGFVTIMKWRSYEPVVFRGEIFGLKDMELDAYLPLPRYVDMPLEVAVLGDGPRTQFEEAGWGWTDAKPLNASLDSYRQFLASATGEWSVAKNGYVRSASGWFSDRSASMLAMGRPVVLQSTGFERWLPVGRGLLTFSNLDEAKAALWEVRARYADHARHARVLAAEAFDYRHVLNDLTSWATTAPDQRVTAPSAEPSR